MGKKRGKGGRFEKKKPEEEPIIEDIPYDEEEMIELDDEELLEVSEEDLYDDSEARLEANEEELIEEKNIWDDLNEELIEGINQETKICKGCGEELIANADNFYRNKGHKDGLDTWCKDCIKKWWKAKRVEMKARKAEGA